MDLIEIVTILLPSSTDSAFSPSVARATNQLTRNMRNSISTRFPSAQHLGPRRGQRERADAAFAASAVLRRGSRGEIMESSSGIRLDQLWHAPGGADAVRRHRRGASQPHRLAPAAPSEIATRPNWLSRVTEMRKTLLAVGWIGHGKLPAVPTLFVGIAAE